MSKINQEMIEVSYKYGKMYANGEIVEKEAIEKIEFKAGMNEKSAKNSVEIMDSLLKEKVYFPTMSAAETIWKLEKIREDYGYEKLLRVVNIVEKHLNTKEAPNHKIREYIKQIRQGGNL